MQSNKVELGQLLDNASLSSLQSWVRITSGLLSPVMENASSAKHWFVHIKH